MRCRVHRSGTQCPSSLSSAQAFLGAGGAEISLGLSCRSSGGDPGMSCTVISRIPRAQTQTHSNRPTACTQLRLCRKYCCLPCDHPNPQPPCGLPAPSSPTTYRLLWRTWPSTGKPKKDAALRLYCGSQPLSMEGPWSLTSAQNEL